jgi:hypothetical protein
MQLSAQNGVRNYVPAQTAIHRQESPSFSSYMKFSLTQGQNGPDDGLKSPCRELEQWCSAIGHYVPILSFIVHVYEK